MSKGLNYALLPRKLIYTDYITPFKLFYRKIRKLLFEGHDLEKVKADIKKVAYSFFDNHIFWNDLNTSKEEQIQWTLSISNSQGTNKFV